MGHFAESHLCHRSGLGCGEAACPANVGETTLRASILNKLANQYHVNGSFCSARIQCTNQSLFDVRPFFLGTDFERG